MDVETHEYSDIKERVFRGRLADALAVAAEFVRRADVSPRSIQTLEITAEKWRVAVYYTEID